jgi:hypothetical protein
MRKIFYVLSIIGLFAVSDLDAQCSYNPQTQKWESLQTGGDCPNAIVTAVPFLRIIPDARGGAMGDVGLALSPDPNSMHYNASNLAFVDKDFAMSATYSPWLRALGLSDVYLAYLSGYKQINELQSMGFGLRYFSLGNIDFTDENGEPAGTGRPNEFEISGAYARKLSDNLSAGITLKFIYSNLAADQTVDGRDIKAGLGGAADISFTYRKEASNGEFAAALALTNLGTKISYQEEVNDYLPANLGLGMAYKVDLDEYNSITFGLDLNKLMVPTSIHSADENYDSNPQNGIPDYKEKSVVSSWFSSFSDAPNGFSEEIKEWTTSFGLEYWYDNQFAVRGGYFYESAVKGNRKYLTVGLGLKYNIFGMNLSYLVPTTNQRNPLDNTLRFSLLFDFGAFE